MTISISEADVRQRADVLLGMSKSDVAERRNYVGASDANILMGGDPEKIHQLWLEKTGQAEPEDLSDNLLVQMGVFTEPLNIFWFEKNTGATVTHRQQKIPHPDRPYLRATLDGKTALVDGVPAVIDAKHCAPFNFDASERAQYYGPQMAVQMACAGVERAILSFLIGNTGWEYHVINRDPLYEAQVLAACATFWAHVQNGTPPVELPSAKAPLPVGMMRKVDMVGSNEWGSWEAQYVANEQASKDFEEAKKSMKAMVESDVGEAKGRLLCIKRSKNGSLTFSKVKN
jgi:predicted phage-related endonuclease